MPHKRKAFRLALWSAAQRGDCAALRVMCTGSGQWLLKAVAHAIRIAVHNDHPAAVQLLLLHVPGFQPSLWRTNRQSRRPRSFVQDAPLLHLATAAGAHDVMRLLLCSDVRSDNAVCHTTTRAGKSCCEFGVDLQRAIDIAADADDAMAVRVLLEADGASQCRFNSVPMQVTTSEAVVRLLLDAGATPSSRQGGFHMESRCAGSLSFGGKWSWHDSLAVDAAARRTGIVAALLPSLYTHRTPVEQVECVHAWSFLTSAAQCLPL